MERTHSVHSLKKGGMDQLLKGKSSNREGKKECSNSCNEKCAKMERASYPDEKKGDAIGLRERERI